MRFSTYLNENKSLKNEATLVLYKIINMVDLGHVDIKDESFRFSVGAMIHKGIYDKVSVVIRKGAEVQVRLGSNRADGTFAVVIDTPKLPERDKIDNLLSETNVFNGFVTAFVGYLQNYHEDGEVEPHSDEIEVENNTNFEENYNNIIKEVQGKVEEFNKVKAEISNSVNDNANVIKDEVTKLSIKNLQSQYIGNSENEFMGIVRKLPGYSKFEGISKELKAKLESRLKTFYRGNIKQLVK